MADPIVVVPYNPEWSGRFQALGRALRTALGYQALRIDHIGSTAVPGLDAKPVIDVQISVASLEPMSYLPALESLDYVWRADNPDLTKRYFREPPGRSRIHLHVRRAGSWSEQFALLFRDYLRAHPGDAAGYASLKHRLGEQFRHDRDGYVDAKAPIIWQLTQRAADWSQLTGWEPGPADAKAGRHAYARVAVAGRFPDQALDTSHPPSELLPGPGTYVPPSRACSITSLSL